MEDRRHILVVDDDAAVREALRAALERQFKVFEAAGGGPALSILTRRRVDLVLLDLEMPGLDGVEVLRRIRRRDRDLPVVILTAHSTRERAEAAADLGVQGYLLKPVKLRALLLKLEMAWAHGKKLAELAVPPSPPIQRVLDRLHQSFPARPPLRELAAAAKLAPNYLCRRFKRETGVKISAYVDDLRIARAQRLLRQTDHPIPEVAHRSGFASLSRFYRAFQRVTGQPPQRYRTARRNALESLPR